MAWPVRKSVFGVNEWNINLSEFMEKLNSVEDEHWWICDTHLKYLNIRIDTRSNNFLLFVDNERIDPDRVVKAIDEYLEKYT
jgi:hypothetical protein